MAKLFNTRYETMAIRSMCTKDPVVSGYLLANLDESYFYNDEAIEAFAALKTSFSKTGTTPNFRLLSQDISLSESARELLAEAETPVRDLAQAQHLHRSLTRLRKTRMCYMLARNILDTLEQPKVDVEELLSSMGDKMARIHSSKMADADILHFGEDSNAFDQIQEQLYDDEDDSCIPTGFRTWDERNGGFLRGSLVVLGGSSGAGKSILANQLNVNQAQMGFRTVMVPLEMSTKEMLSRTMSSVSKMDSIDIVLHRLASGERDLVWKRMKKFNRRITAAGGNYAIFKPRTDMSAEEILAAVHSLNADVVYIDYISLLKGVGGDDSWQKLGEVARAAKIYAEVHNRVVVLLAQVSEEGKIRYAQAIKEHASVAWVFVATKESKEKGYLHVDPIKSRNQIGKDFTLKIEYSQTRVSDLDPKELEALEREKQQKASSRKGKSATSSEVSKETSNDDSELPDL